MNGEQESKLLALHFPDIKQDQRDQLIELIPRYKYWNERINVISRKDIDNLFVHHIIHGLCISKFTTFTAGSKILDLGTGGGIPGIPLAIIYPDVQFHLIDARAKKLKVINDIIDSLELRNVSTQHVRAEDLKGGYDFVISRAVASANQLVNWSKPLILSEHINAIPNGLICLKGGSLKEELKPLRKNCYIEQVPITEFFPDAHFNEKFLVYIQLP